MIVVVVMVMVTAAIAAVIEQRGLRRGFLKGERLLLAFLLEAQRASHLLVEVRAAAAVCRLLEESADSGASRDRRLTTTTAAR